MTGKSHLIIGASTATAIGLTTNPSILPIAVPLSILGALIVDLDTPKSKINTLLKKASMFIIPYLIFAILTNKINFQEMFRYKGLSSVGFILFVVCIFIAKKSKHRRFSHTFEGTGLFSLASLMISPAYCIWFIMGYASHILADSCTKSKIAFLAPISERKFGLGIIRTGTALETVVVVAYVAICVIYAYLVCGADVVSGMSAFSGLLNTHTGSYSNLNSLSQIARLLR